MRFIKKNIVDENLGEILKQTREEKNISLEKLAKAAKINIEYLQALENGEYYKLPKGVYGKNFLREYCFYLKLNFKKMLELYKREAGNLLKVDTSKEAFRHQKVKRYQFMSLPKLFRNSILVVVMLLFLGYLGWRLQALIAPPSLVIYFPPENFNSSEPVIEVKGLTDPEARIFVNSVEILSELDGSFSQAIHLQQGINNIKITAKKKYGRDAEAARQVLMR